MCYHWKDLEGLVPFKAPLCIMQVSPCPVTTCAHQAGIAVVFHLVLTLGYAAVGDVGGGGLDN